MCTQGRRGKKTRKKPKIRHNSATVKVVESILHHGKHHVQVKALASNGGGEYVPGYNLFEWWI